METEQVQCVYVCVCVCIVCVTRPGHGDPGRWSRHHHRAPAGSLSNNPYLLESMNGHSNSSCDPHTNQPRKVTLYEPMAAVARRPPWCSVAVLNDP